MRAGSPAIVPWAIGAQALVLLSALTLTGCASTAAAPQNFTVEPLAPGVWAVLNRDWSAASANAAIVDLGDETLVFDSLFTPEAGAELRRTAERLTGRPVRYLVLSHWHNDHIRGAQEFPRSSIITTVRTRELIAELEPKEIAGEKRVVDSRIELEKKRLGEEADPERRRERLFWVSYYEAMKRSHPQLRLTLPNVTFEHRMIIEGTARRVVLLEHRGHTGSDAIAYLPAERIAFLGDLHFVNHQPYLPHGDPDEHRAALRAIKELAPERVLPGHGPVSGPRTLDTLIGFIDHVELVAAGLAAQGKTKLTDADRSEIVTPEPYQQWWFGNFYFANVRFMLQRPGRSSAQE